MQGRERERDSFLDQMSSDRESCNSRHLTWLIKSCCIPNPHDTKTTIKLSSQPQPDATTISSLPDDIVLDFISRVPPSSLPSLSLVCRRWSRLLHSPHFSDIRRRLQLLRHTAVALAATDFGFSAATLLDGAWNPSLFLPTPHNFHSFLSQARVASIGPRIFVIGRNATVLYDTWGGTVTPRSAMIFPRKKFALATVSGKLYIAGGSSRTAAVEEYDPITNTWSIVGHAPRRRYGCIGASSGGVFYVIGGLRIGASEQNELSRATYASSMDLFDVESRRWLKSRGVPGGGCVVACCAAAGKVYVLTSHTVELSFWSFDAKRKCSVWCRGKSPPLPGLVRIESRIRFNCVGMGDKVVLIQVCGCMNEENGSVLVYDCVTDEWDRVVDLPVGYRRAAYVSMEC